MAEPTTRDQILVEARHCFAAQGFEGTSLNDIAAGVGIRRPSLLHHFDSKEAIYRQILSDALAEWGDQTEAARNSESDGWELVDSIVAASFRFFVANPEIIVIVRREAMTDQSPLGFNLGVALRPYFRRAVTFFERQMDQGVFRRHDAENLVLTGYGALLTYFSDHVMLKGLISEDPFSEASLEARFEHMRSFIRAALEPVGGAE
ncbi:MAG: TetR/AcrR family transcriptional regulator [Acidimicrobiales bacterium]|nr:TetR/AcrR family transcriptional regulator [Acidimicrobiales bacterium]